jgi:hypothetical protein
VLTVLADCIVPIHCINPKTSYSTAAPPTLDYWIAALILVIGFALAWMLILIRGRM